MSWSCTVLPPQWPAPKLSTVALLCALGSEFNCAMLGGGFSAARLAGGGPEGALNSPSGWALGKPLPPKRSPLPP